jgi:hypothetical protein
MTIRQMLMPLLLICFTLTISASCGNLTSYDFDEVAWFGSGDLSKLVYSAESHSGNQTIKIVSNDASFKGGIGAEIELEAGTYLYTGWIKGKIALSSVVKFLATEPDNGEHKMLRKSIDEWTYYQTKLEVPLGGKIKITPAILRGKGEILVDDVKIYPFGNKNHDVSDYLLQSVVQKEETSVDFLSIPTLAKKPIIDGELGQEEYLGSYFSTTFPGTCEVKELLLRDPVEMNMGVYGNCLYVFIKCYEPEIQNLVSDEDVWPGDFVAIFFGTDRSQYHQLAVNAEGVQYDDENIIVDDKRNYNPKWEGTWKAKTSKGRDYWTAEYELPLSDFRIEEGTTSEKTVYCNVCRQRVKQQTLQFYSWSNVGGNFHQPDKFRQIVLFTQQAEIEPRVDFAGPVRLGTSPTDMLLTINNNSAKDQRVLIEGASFLGSQQIDGIEDTISIKAKEKMQLKIPLVLPMPSEKENSITIKFMIKDLGKNEYLTPLNLSVEVPKIVSQDYMREQVTNWERGLLINEQVVATQKELTELNSKMQAVKERGYIISEEEAIKLIRSVRLAEAAFSKQGDLYPFSNLKGMLCFVKKSISTEKVLPNTAIPGAIGEVVSCTLTPKEYESASFVLRSIQDLTSVNIEVSDLNHTETGGIIPASAVDLRVVKCWYQGGTAWADIDFSPVRVLVPELLLYDDDLIRVNHKTKTHEFKVTEKDGTNSYLPTTVGREHDGRSWSFTAKEFPIKDSSSLQPVDLVAGENKQFWITIKAPENAISGLYTGRIKFASGDEDLGFITLQVQVLPFTLPEPALEYSIYYRGCLNYSDEAMISSESKSELQMRREYEDMIAHGITNPTVYQRYNDRRLLGTVLASRKELGLADKTLYYLGIETDATIIWNSNQREWLKGKVKNVMGVAKSYGVSEIYIYGHDEATGETLIKQRPAWEAVHEIGGKMFVAGYPQQSDSALDLLDLLVCAGKPLQTEAEKWHAAGNKIFVYAYPQGGPEDPELFRRNFGLVTLKSGYDGVMTYTYQDPCPGNPWDDFEGKKSYRGIMMTYPTVDGVIDTLAIEGFREAVDDVRYITLLYQKIEAAKESQDPQKRLDAAEAEEYITKLDPEGDLDQIREKIISYILKLDI